MFDRGLALYEAMLVEGDTRVYPSAHLYGTTTVHQSTGDQRVFSARMAANAARAVTLGLGRMRAPEPPPFYAFDPGRGCLDAALGTAVGRRTVGADDGTTGGYGEPSVAAGAGRAFGLVVMRGRIGFVAMHHRGGRRAVHGGAARARRRAPGDARAAREILRRLDER